MTDNIIVLILIIITLVLGIVGGIGLSYYALNEKGNVMVDGLFIGSDIPDSAREDIETIIIEKYPESHVIGAYGGRWFPISGPPQTTPLPSLTPTPTTQKECWCREVIPQ